ncbi:hypothetical protein T4B_7311 [Trichinella pseudospiralis]|uniref:Uncharacterized protein n=1 Tax=Trichinella pseudospiralis TaxID=6337 RepID=A0A0V1IWL2_TRIPS|nr:hypothetical protein T4B_7311 [Trichinella pseudospiralis]KRZ27151.1 hypothetical protein T4C_6781 [Trichinella pseudospiralis]KRZ27163.1 hypothetical protein T4C_4547 [Trichinella pseudospiralis]
MIFHTNADIANTLISNIEKLLTYQLIALQIRNLHFTCITLMPNAQTEEFFANYKMNVKNYVEDTFCPYQELL